MEKVEFKKNTDQGMSYLNYVDRITIEPGKRGGKPCVRGMRITVGDVLMVGGRHELGGNF